MLRTLKTYTRRLLQDSSIWEVIQHVTDGWKVRSWEKEGKPNPPPHAIKKQILATYVAKYGTDTLIETGTYLGDMIYAMRGNFQQIYSIELSEDLADKAMRRFRPYEHIKIIAGDSGDILPKILGNISAPCSFWLDGHYSGGITAKGRADTPISKEVTAILDHKIKTHIILIDDARCFDGTDGYPTIVELRELVRKNGPGYNLLVEDDVIRIIPKASFTD
jgi:hypothetical protein